MSPARPAEATAFFTVQHPDDYHPDWAGFYESALARRDAVRRRFPHALDVKYGDDPHQPVVVAAVCAAVLWRRRPRATGPERDLVEREQPGQA